MVIFYVATAVGGLLFLGGLYILINYAREQWKYRHFRGPFALPVLGNCYNPAAMIFLKYLIILRKQYGKVFTFFKFTQGVLVICDPVIVRRILSDSKTFYKGKEYDKFGKLAFGDGLVTSNADKHRNDRQIFGKYFIRSSIVKFAETINSVTIATIDQYLPKRAEGSRMMNIEAFFARLALRNFMKFSLSCDMSHDPEAEEQFCHMISRGSNAMGRVIVFNLPLLSFIPEIKTIDKCIKLMERIFVPILEQRRANIKSGDDQADDCLSAMIREQMSMKQMQAHFNTLVAAGHDTTAFFLSYMVFLLANHPTEQEKLYHAITTHMQGKGKHNNENHISPDDVTEIKYLSYVMMETLRLYSIIPAVSRVAREEVHFKDSSITIPEGATVMIPMFVLNRDPEIWNSPNDFRPERFQEKGNDFTSAKDGYFPFGYGTRTCIGNTFAQIESGIVLIHLMQQFVFEAAENFRPTILAGISLTTSNGMNVILRLRST